MFKTDYIITNEKLVDYRDKILSILSTLEVENESEFQRRMIMAKGNLNTIKKNLAISKEQITDVTIVEQITNLMTLCNDGYNYYVNNRMMIEDTDKADIDSTVEAIKVKNEIKNPIHVSENVASAIGNNRFFIYNTQDKSLNEFVDQNDALNYINSTIASCVVIKGYEVKPKRVYTLE